MSATPTRMRLTEAQRGLRALAEGYRFEGSADDRYVFVENPGYQPDDGSSPNLTIDVFALLAQETDP